MAHDYRMPPAKDAAKLLIVSGIVRNALEKAFGVAIANVLMEYVLYGEVYNAGK